MQTAPQITEAIAPSPFSKLSAAQLKEAFNLADVNFEHNPADLIEKMRSIRNELIRRCDNADRLQEQNRYGKMHRAMSQRVFAGLSWIAAEKKKNDAVAARPEPILSRSEAARRDYFASPEFLAYNQALDTYKITLSLYRRVGHTERAAEVLARDFATMDAALLACRKLQSHFDAFGWNDSK